jgi:diguanylate cyclase (GGDEF)-like protein
MRKKIIVVEDCNTTKKIIKNTLQKTNTIFFCSKTDLFQTIQNNNIDAILFSINFKNQADLQITEFLKSNFISFQIPVIFLLDSFNIKNFLSDASKKGNSKIFFDDFIKKPIDPIELKAKLLLNDQKIKSNVLNPLTKLPGNTHLYKIIKERLATPLAIFYLDLDNFKAYNDKYGFKAGDNVIKSTAQIIRSILKRHANPTDFVGHLGGDDFIILTTPAKAEKIAQEICSKFDKEVAKFYTKTDFKNKKIVTTNRVGKKVTFPLLSLSIAIITNERKKLTCIAQISQIACELKKYAKMKPKSVKSNFVKERRLS